MKLRTATAALAATASAALTAAAALASLAGPASAASLRTDGAATTTDISMTVDGRATPATVAFDQQPLVELDFDTTPGPATTTLTLKPARIGFGQQQTEQLTVQVAPVAQGTPTGNVAIKAGATTLCSAPVPDSGFVTCNLQIGQLPVGSYQLTASYAGDSNFASSSSSQQLLTITAKSAAKASLAALKTPTVTFGQEQAEQFTANVTGQVAGVAPTGKVTVKAGSVALCSFTLAAGPGHCRPSTTKLNPGTYHVTASYGGNVTYAQTTSGPQTLTVTAAPTTTLSTLSKTKVKAGQEQQETLKVAVAPKTKTSLTPAGQVTVKAGRTTLCVITLKKARGSCPLTARQLRPGTYHLAAAYPGVSPFARSASPAKTLTVTK